MNGAGDDVEILRLGAEWLPLQRRYNTLNAQCADMVHIPNAIHREFDTLVPQHHDLAEKVADLRATSLEALKVKAAMLLFYSGYLIDGSVMWSNHDELMGWSIARDMLGDEAARPDADYEFLSITPVGPANYPA
jgi:hypothetical protein